MFWERSFFVDFIPKRSAIIAGEGSVEFLYLYLSPRMRVGRCDMRSLNSPSPEFAVSSLVGQNLFLALFEATSRNDLLVNASVSILTEIFTIKIAFIILSRFIANKKKD